MKASASSSLPPSIGSAGALAFALALAVSAGLCRAQGGGPLQNWFSDPFFQISSAVPDCPVPAGPFTSEEDSRSQAHHRAERGTSCWLARACDRPNAYAYDQDIAATFQAAAREGNPFGGTTLWVTVQGRVV